MDSRKTWHEKYQEKHPDLVIWHTAKSRAKKKNLEFTIERSDIVIPTHCPILGCELTFERRKGRQWNGMSLDRIDSTKGYIKGNVWVISCLANRMKQDAPLEQLRKFGEWAIKQ
jgi:hypothetical protein